MGQEIHLEGAERGDAAALAIQYKLLNIGVNKNAGCIAWIESQDATKG